MEESGSCKWKGRSRSHNLCCRVLVKRRPYSDPFAKRRDASLGPWVHASRVWRAWGHAGCAHSTANQPVHQTALSGRRSFPSLQSTDRGIHGHCRRSRDPYRREVHKHWSPSACEGGRCSRDLPARCSDKDRYIPNAQPTLRRYSRPGDSGSCPNGRCSPLGASCTRWRRRSTPAPSSLH